MTTCLPCYFAWCRHSPQETAGAGGPGMTVMRARLSDKILPSISTATVPAYDRSRVSPGIVHLGTGAFHRAHQAVYVDDCLAAGDMGWGIIGASLRSPS